MNPALLENKNCYLVLSHNAQSKKLEANIDNNFFRDFLIIKSIKNLGAATLNEFRHFELQIINPITNHFIAKISFEEIHLQRMNQSRGYIRKNVPVRNLSSVIIRISPDIPGEQFEFQLNYAFSEKPFLF